MYDTKTPCLSAALMPAMPIPRPLSEAKVSGGYKCKAEFKDFLRLTRETWTVSLVGSICRLRTRS